MKRGADHVATAGEEAVGRAPVVFERQPVTDSKAHIRGLCRHIELVQETFEIGVVPVVVNNEPGIDRVRAGLGFHVDGVGVPSRVVRRLVHGKLVIRVQRVRADKSRNPSPDDRDLHLILFASGRVLDQRDRPHAAGAKRADALPLVARAAPGRQRNEPARAFEILGVAGTVLHPFLEQALARDPDQQR